MHVKGTGEKEKICNLRLEEYFMKKRIISYRQLVDSLLDENSDKTDWESVLEEHLIQIGFFQHERLIHLIVTVTFAIMTLMSIVASIMLMEIPLFVLALLFLVLLIPYIFHYYILENETQKMYDQYDKIWKIVLNLEHE